MPGKTDSYQPGNQGGSQGGGHEPPTQESIDLLTRLLQEFERRSTNGGTELPEEVERDIAYATAALESIQSALALGESPIIISSPVTPSEGGVDGGTRIKIAGSHFLPGATVRLGDNPATEVLVVSLTEIQATTPRTTLPLNPDGVAVVDVVVDTLAGSARLKGGYTYRRPRP